MPMKQVTEEIVDFVGQWEKIVDAPVLLRSLDAELGDRVLLVLEQTAAFPVPQISEDRVPDRSPEQIMDFPVSQNMEAYAGRVRDIPLERVQEWLAQG